MLSRNSIAKKLGEMEDVQLREEESLRILSSKAKMAKVYRYAVGAVYGYSSISNIINETGNIIDGSFFTGEFVMYKVGSILASIGLAALPFLIRLKPEREYNSYLKDRKVSEISLLPLIAPKYSGIMILLGSGFDM